MASSATDFSKKSSFITSCFCLQFLFNSCSPVEIVESNEERRNLYEIYDFLDELHSLEHKVDFLKCKMDFRPSYNSLKERIDQFEMNTTIPKTPESLRLMRYLYNAVLNREYNLKYNYESYLIVNITDHFDSVKNDLDILRGSFNIRTILNILWKYKEQYKLGIQDRMRESNILLKNFTEPSLEKMEYELSYKIDSLVAQMIELFDTENEKEKLNEKRKMLEKALVQRAFLTSFQLVGHVMSFLSGSVFSAVLNIGRGSTSYKSLCSRNPSNTRELMETISELKILEEKIRMVLKPNIQPFMEVLGRCYDAAEVYPHNFGNFLEKILEIKQKLTREELDFHQFWYLKDVFQKELDNIKLTLEAEDWNQNEQITMIKLKRTIALGNSISNISQNFGDNTSEFQPVKYYNYQSEKKLEMLNKYEDGIQDLVDKVVKEIKRDIYFSNRLKKEPNPSKCSLFVANWKVPLFLKETKKILSEMTNLFEEEEGEFLNILNGFLETMTALAEVYDHIQNYLEQQLLFNNMEDIINDDTRITNPKYYYQQALNEFELMIRLNIVLQRYTTVFETFTQFVFPFVSRYLYDGLHPLQLYRYGTVEKAVSQIEIMQSRIKLYEQTVGNPDNYTAKMEFSSANNSSRPFYVWKNNNHRSAILNLLSGQEVLLKADISGSPIGMDGLKFETIGLEFKTRNRNFQGNLTELLKDFRLRGVHVGNSYYMYDSKVYLIPSNSREFDFPFEMKIETGEIMLSPYASWKFTLVKKTDEADFEQFAKYVKEVDLELVGSGFYVEYKFDNLKLWYMINNYKFYKAIDEKDFVC